MCCVSAPEVLQKVRLEKRMNDCSTHNSNQPPTQQHLTVVPNNNMQCMYKTSSAPNANATTYSLSCDMWSLGVIIYIMWVYITPCLVTLNSWYLFLSQVEFSCTWIFQAENCFLKNTTVLSPVLSVCSLGIEHRRLYILLLTIPLMTTINYYNIIHHKNQLLPLLLMKTIIVYHHDMSSKFLVL